MNKPSIYKEVNTPCYIVDESLLKHNLEILRHVCDETGCKILLAQKAFSMYYFYPLIGKYLDGATASGLYEAKLAAEELCNQEIEDVFDYRFFIDDTYLEVLIKKANGEEWLLEIDKDYDEDLGIEFESSLMDEYRSCHNKCIFCFIDQMPKGMRDTLYFKDDDSRLSFLQGNYVTLTNMKDKDIYRIIRYHLAPINISVCPFCSATASP